MSDNSLSSIRVRVILRTLEDRAPFFTQALTPAGAIAEVATAIEVEEMVRLGYLEHSRYDSAEYVALTTQAHIFLRGID